MSTAHLDDDPKRGQFHGGVMLRRELQTAVMVGTSPTDDADASKGLHYHAHPYFWMLLGGDCSEKIEGKGERVYEPMKLTYHPAGEKHSHHRGPNAPSGFGIVLAGDSFPATQEIAPMTEEPCVLEGAEFTHLAYRLAKEFERTDTASSLILEALTLELIGATSRITLKGDTKPPLWLKNAKDLLHATFRENVKMSDIAAHVGIHPVHLGTEFRKHFHCTPGEFVRRLRMEHACQLLSSTDLPVAELASLCGFYDESHFCRGFKAHSGYTPSEYRKERKG